MRHLYQGARRYTGSIFTTIYFYYYTPSPVTTPPGIDLRTIGSEARCATATLQRLMLRGRSYVYLNGAYEEPSE